MSKGFQHDQIAELRHGVVTNVGTGRVAVHFVSDPQLDKQPLEVELVVLPAGGTEQRLTLHEGDRFAVGPDTWALKGVDNVGTYDYVVRIAAVDA